jgi:dTDP-4-dehydrorhamnose reductase
MTSTSLLITGAKGMLGRTLMRRLAARTPVPSDRAALDLVDAEAVDAALAGLRPAVVVNCAGMTAVDRCEGEREAAFAANATAPANLARACQRHGARLVHVSTDYVFPGDLDRPYHEGDAPGPRTVYGQSKWAGEQAVRDLCADHLIVRTAWLYGPGGPSFVHTMLRLAAQPGPPLRVVDDQHGNPTSTDAVATALDALLDQPAPGTVHLSCAGEATWCGLARELFARAGVARDVTPCTTAEFPRPAPRPANSRLEKRALQRRGLAPMPPWQEALGAFLRDFPHG